MCVLLVFFCTILVMMLCVFFFKQKTAYDMRISDWSSDVCSSDLSIATPSSDSPVRFSAATNLPAIALGISNRVSRSKMRIAPTSCLVIWPRRQSSGRSQRGSALLLRPMFIRNQTRSEEHTSELQSLMRISYAVFCLNKHNTHTKSHPQQTQKYI